MLTSILLINKNKCLLVYLQQYNSHSVFHLLIGGSLSYSFFFVYTFMLFSILFRCSTSPAPLAVIPSTPPIFLPGNTWGLMLVLGGATDKLLALKYGYSCLSITSTKAILSSLSSCSIGVSLLKIIILIMNLHLIEIQMHIFIWLQDVRIIIQKIVQEICEQQSCSLMLFSW